MFRTSTIPPVPPFTFPTRTCTPPGGCTSFSALRHRVAMFGSAQYCDFPSTDRTMLQFHATMRRTEGRTPTVSTGYTHANEHSALNAPRSI